MLSITLLIGIPKTLAIILAGKKLASLPKNLPRNNLRSLESSKSMNGLTNSSSKLFIVLKPPSPPNVELIPVFSNSEGAEKISQDNEACIGSKTLTELYGLNLVNENIEDSKENTTRFVILSHDQQDKSDNSKVSLIISPPDSDASGSLYNLLKPFASEDINLLRIESRPFRGQLWSYAFFIDCEGHIDDTNIQNAIYALKNQKTNVKILGSYPSHNDK